jgi:hypothetical protein
MHVETLSSPIPYHTKGPTRETVLEREVTLEHPSFQLQLEGVMPVREGERRLLRRKDRNRILQALLRHLKADQSLEFRFSRDPCRAVGLSILGWESSCLDANTHLETIVTTSLGGLRHAYQFGSRPVGSHAPSFSRSHTVRPRVCELNTAQRTLGFNATLIQDTPSLLLADVGHAGSVRGMFSSLIDFVTALPHPAELSIRCHPLTLTETQLEQVDAAIEELKRSSARGQSPRAIECQRSQLEAWRSTGAGIRFSCHLSSDEELAPSLIAQAGAEIFGCLGETENTTEARQHGLDLSTCRYYGATCPDLLPSAEALENTRPKRVFNATLPNLHHSGPVLGSARSGDSSVRVMLDEGSRSRHTYIIGATGTGKSTLLCNLIEQDLQSGHGFALIDPHGDLFENVLTLVPKHRAKDVVLFEPASNRAVPGLNFLNIPEGPQRRLQVNFVITEFLNIFDQLYDLRQCGGPQFELYFRNALLLLIESRYPGATLLDLPTVFNNKKFRDHLCDKCGNPQVVEFWKATAEKATGEHSLPNFTSYITSKLTSFTHSGPIRSIIGQPDTTIHFNRLLNHRGILLVNLSKGQLGDMDARLLGMLVIGQLFSAALSRVTMPPSRRQPFQLYVDEFQNFITDSIASLVAESRKFGLHLTLANQTLAQLTAHAGRQNLPEAILGNVGNMVVFRVGAPDANRLALFTEPHLPHAELQRLPNYHAFARLLSGEGPLDPFVFEGAPPPTAHPEQLRLLQTIRRNQKRWSNPLDKVEKWLNCHLSQMRSSPDSQSGHTAGIADPKANPQRPQAGGS